MKKLTTLLLALVASTCAIWAQNNIITYTAFEQLTEVTSGAGLHTYAFGVTMTSHTFSNGTGTITFSGSVTRIGNSAFVGCSGLMSIGIPNSVTSIGSGAFCDCTGLTSVTIPSSVTSIGDYAFAWCSGLTSLTCEAATPPTCDEPHVFSEVDKSIPLYVPAQSVTAYQAANVWKDFTNILPIQAGDGSDITTALEATAVAANGEKVMINGRVYIVKDGRIYDTLGRNY